uniref:Calponin-homology (CH) domain-containing protein n=1 Tax=Myripristis murdjan TaxID=586833 RepID=A0A667XCW4_9TELE
TLQLKNIESRLKVLLPDDVGAALMDGVVLCHLANHICPRSVASIHVPSPAVPKLSMAKCRRNVENFLDAFTCHTLCIPSHTYTARVSQELILPAPHQCQISRNLMVLVFLEYQ